MSQAQSAGQLGGAAAAGIGMAAGVVGPLALPIGMALGGSIGGLFGGNDGGKNHAGNRARRANKYNQKLHKFNWSETQRGYDYQVEAQDIQKKNANRNLKYQERTNDRNYDHNMAIRSYEFKQANRAYDQSVATANEQLSFNDQAAAFGKMQQQRAHGEQLIDLLFSENQSLMQYSIQTAGLTNQKRQLGLQERSMMGKAQNATQRSFVEELEAEGAAQAKGSGRSNAKAMQAAVAKAGANQAAIADELMFGLQGLDISTDDINVRAAAMRTQLSIDQLMLEATRDNLDAKTANIMRKIDMDKAQADAVARAKIHLKPEMSPAMPKPLALPRPKYQDVYVPKKPPKPKKHTNYQQSSGYFGQAMSTLAAATPSIVNAFKGGGYQPNMNVGGVSSLSDFSFSNSSIFNSDFGVSNFGNSFGQGLDIGSSFGGNMSFNSSSLGSFSNLTSGAGGAGYPGLY